MKITNNVRDFHGSDEFGRLAVNKLVEPNRKTSVTGIILYVNVDDHSQYIRI